MNLQNRKRLIDLENEPDGCQRGGGEDGGKRYLESEMDT